VLSLAGTTRSALSRHGASRRSCARGRSKRGQSTPASIHAALEEGLLAKRWRSKVDYDIGVAEAARHVNGTPAFLRQRTLLSGAQPYEAFKEMVDAEHREGQGRLRPCRATSSTRSSRPQNFKPPSEIDDDDGPKEDTKTVYRVPVAGSPVRGVSPAFVTIVEFSIPVPVLQTCRSDARAHPARVPEHRPHRVEGRAALFPHARRARRGDRARRVGPTRRSGLLGRPRSALRFAAEARRLRSRERRTCGKARRRARDERR